jgi:ABC-type branched-subunit amino acid transport system substrate-binding protein
VELIDGGGQGQRERTGEAGGDRMTRNLFEQARPRRGRLIGAGLAVVVLVAAVLVYVMRRGEPECADGIPRVGVRSGDQVRQECIGVTGSFAFEPRFGSVMAALRKENAFATQGGAGTYVTLAFLGPLTNADERVVHQLEGAVTGQHRANQEPLVGEHPRIKLVLANMDSTEGHWRQISDELIEMVRGPDHLVAVAGLGLSQRETLWAAQRLRTADLPMVSDIVTTDKIDKTQAVGLARVNPRVGDEVAALAEYVGAKTKLRRAMLVNSAKEGDLYAESLTTAFKKSMGRYWRAGGEVGDPFGENPGNEFNVIVGNLCSVRPPDMIMYAGRGGDLPKFIGYLSNRNCHPDPITIVTGSDTVRLILDDPENRQAVAALGARRNPISLIYTPLAEPSVLRDRSPRLYEGFERSFRNLGFEPEHLRTGWAIMSHDAVITEALAIRRAAPVQGLPAAAKVRDSLYLLSSPANSVPGASGQFQLDPDTGNRAGLQLPVLRLRPDREPEVLGLYTPAAARPRT